MNARRSVVRTLFWGALVAVTCFLLARYWVPNEAPARPSSATSQAVALASNYQMGFDAGFDAATQGSTYQAFGPCGARYALTRFGQGFCVGYVKGER